jgi:hypothetical protein
MVRRERDRETVTNLIEIFYFKRINGSYEFVSEEDLIVAEFGESKFKITFTKFDSVAVIDLLNDVFYSS